MHFFQKIHKTLRCPRKMNFIKRMSIPRSSLNTCINVSLFPEFFFSQQYFVNNGSPKSFKSLKEYAILLCSSKNKDLSYLFYTVAVQKHNGHTFLCSP